MATTPTAAKTTASHARTYLIALAGNPNCGKTTLFNLLTGLRQKVGNYPGVTVEKREGVMTGDASIHILDLPGTYSLSARSLDEQVARDVLLGREQTTQRPDAVLIVIDATNLERNLYLASQIIDLGLPAIIACNMMDLVEKAGHKLDLARLSERLGVPVVPTVAHRGQGLVELRAAIQQVCRGLEDRVRRARAWSLDEPIEREVETVASAITASQFAPGLSADGTAVLLLSEADLPHTNHLPAAVKETLAGAFKRLGENPEHDPCVAITVGRYGWLGGIVDECLQLNQNSQASISDRLDRVLTHKFWGLLIFSSMMALMFYSIFTLAEPLMGLIENTVGAAQDAVRNVMQPGVLRDLITDGILAGVGAVVVFFPQICILFLFIALLEDTGYMARAAFLMDRIMSRVGLHGKSFIPLLSSHACAIPGIMAARTIESPKDRIATILVAPLMSCSARLPVYTVLIAACLPVGALGKAGVLFSMYGLGIVTALAMATLFKKTLLRGPTPAFIMELPPYRLPRAGTALRVMWDRSKLFLTRAGTTILAITVVLWAMVSFPKSPERAERYEAQRQAVQAGAAEDLDAQLEAIDHAEAAENLQNSLAGRMGRTIEPLIRPLGYDWRIGIGLISSFAAREVFVGTMGVVLSVGEADEESDSLREQIRNATWPDGSRVFTPLVAVGLMVFYVLACQCVSTIAVVRRETNSWRWPLFMLGYMSVLAYLGALLVYQGGRALGF